MPRRCKYCQAEIPAHSKSETVFHKKQYCSFDHIAKHGRELARVEPYKPKREKQSKAKTESLPHQLELTQVNAFNKMIRLLDKGKPCISCGKPNDGTFHAGHFRSVGSSPHLRFDPRNCHAQCGGCNLSSTRRQRYAKSAETIAKAYELTLRERHGDFMVDWIQGPHPASNWTAEELKQLRKVFLEEIRRLEKGSAPSRDWRSMVYTQRSLIDERVD